MLKSSDISYYIISLGCSKNLVDSENINGRMDAAGFVSAGSSEDADIIIINTCGFIGPAKDESIETILEASELKGDADTSAFVKKIVVCGCLTERYFDDIKKDMPEIDFIYGIPGVEFVPSMCSEFGIEYIDSARAERKTISASKPAYSYIKISDGCSNNCSYCAIPIIRGAKVCFHPDVILADAQRAVKSGAKELIVVAQDSADYECGGTGLPGILKKISEINGSEWIRVMYCHPDNIKDELIEEIKSNRKIVKYLDVPFQHASEKILTSMGRRGNSAIYLDLIARIRKEIPSIVLRSTFMVGFPGETEEDFNILTDFVKKARLDRVGCFTYSPEDGTAASLLPDQLSEKIKKQRSDKLMKIQQEISAEKMNAMIGKRINVIVEERIDDVTFACRTEFDAPEIDGIFYLTAESADLHSIVAALVTDAVEYDLIGVPA